MAESILKGGEFKIQDLGELLAKRLGDRFVLTGAGGGESLEFTGRWPTLGRFHDNAP